MRKINKDFSQILSEKYKTWVTNLENNNTRHPLSRTYYDDIIMDLYKCQDGVCAYTERFICPNDLHNITNWNDGSYIISDFENFKRTDHAGELDHFDPNLKSNQYWLWDNLFMIDSTINSRKSNSPVHNYLKPDLEAYSPKKYFDYDEKTHRFIPNTDIEDITQKAEIQYMIDEVLFLNHGVIKNDRCDFINNIKYRKNNGLDYKIDRFFTATSWCLQ